MSSSKALNANSPIFSGLNDGKVLPKLLTLLSKHGHRITVDQTASWVHQFMSNDKNTAKLAPYLRVRESDIRTFLHMLDKEGFLLNALMDAQRTAPNITLKKFFYDYALPKMERANEKNPNKNTKAPQQRDTSEHVVQDEGVNEIVVQTEVGISQAQTRLDVLTKKSNAKLDEIATRAQFKIREHSSQVPNSKGLPRPSAPY